MTKFVVEILKELNEDISLAPAHLNNQALRITLEYAFDKTKKFVLPEGDPPFKPDVAPLGMSPGNFNMEVKKFYVFCRADLTALKREALFIQLLEGIHPSEAAMMLAVKDQNLARAFPNLTFESLTAAGLLNVPPENAAVAPVKSESRGKGRPAGSKNKTKEEESMEVSGNIDNA